MFCVASNPCLACFFQVGHKIRRLKPRLQMFDLESLPPAPELTLCIDSQAVIVSSSNLLDVFGKFGLFSFIVVTQGVAT